MALRIRRRKLFGWLAVLPVVAFATMIVGGYFDRVALHYEEPLGPRRDGLVAVYFSSDMGLSVGAGEGAVNELRTRGIPVMAVNSSALFLRGRDRTFVDGLVAEALRQALARSGADSAALIGSSFGADILDTGIGALPADLRRRISSVVLVVPGTEVFFHANPSGLFYTGAPDSNPRSTARLLRGLAVTCIYGSQEDDSLCRTPELTRASLIALDDGHMMLGHYHALAETAANAALFPPAPML
jgi:type IV secretory pathway VirJ component